jgi:hypothetical protein
MLPLELTESVIHTTPAVCFVNYMADFFNLLLKAYWAIYYYHHILNYSWLGVISL